MLWNDGSAVDLNRIIAAVFEEGNAQSLDDSTASAHVCTNTLAVFCCKSTHEACCGRRKVVALQHSKGQGKELARGIQGR